MESFLKEEEGRGKLKKMEKKPRSSKEKKTVDSSRKAGQPSKSRKKSLFGTCVSILLIFALLVLLLAAFLQVKYSKRGYALIQRDREPPSNYFMNGNRTAIYTTQKVVEGGESEAAVLFVHGFGE